MPPSASLFQVQLMSGMSKDIDMAIFLGHCVKGEGAMRLTQFEAPHNTEDEGDGTFSLYPLSQKT